jgi:hypothetical protein
MAKVTGPLFSIEARGKIADAMVHFPWKGLNVVRGWVKPANKQTEDQGDVRLIVGGLGRSMAHVSLDSLYHADLLDQAVAPQTWNSHYISEMWALNNVDVAAFLAAYTLYLAHTAKAAFDGMATSMGFTSFDVAYKGTTIIMTGGFQCYLLAQYGVRAGGLGANFYRAPYTTALADWTITQTALMQIDLQAAV